ncbi:serine hydrolase [Pantoea sp. Aalb]|uniref:serine hydrolase n=1 Tax=Pantoea sp. Aalb TaxID=2576762 RepID=UPI001327AED0|nr:serine hydrolase [Pantoea sp. Aalb]MXP67275.1 hypothetical protein [Pantoea sp. Aalb]
MVKIDERGQTHLNDPLSKYTPFSMHVPTFNGRPISLIHLSKHTSSLPREQPRGKIHRQVFVLSTKLVCWK